MSTHATHTPGPWHVTVPMTGEDVTVTSYNNKPKNPVFVARVYGPGILSHDTAQRNANARLIAAAPELLAALRDLLTDFEHDDRQLPQTLARCRTAIAKAEGKDE